MGARRAVSASACAGACCWEVRLWLVSAAEAAGAAAECADPAGTVEAVSAGAAVVATATGGAGTGLTAATWARPPHAASAMHVNQAKRFRNASSPIHEYRP